MRKSLGLIVLAGVAGCSSPESEAGDPSRVADPSVFVTEQALSIGELEGDLPYRFGGVTDAHRLSDGRIVVGDCQVGELRYFDSRGVHLRTVGTLGQGPGEFSWLARIIPIGGDSIAAFDALSRRVSVFSPEGEFVRSFVAGGGLFAVAGALGSGSFAGIVSEPRGEPDEGTIYRPPHWVVVRDREGRVLDSLGPFPGHERAVSGAVRFGRSARWSVSPAGLAYSASDASGPLVFDARLEDSTRVELAAVPGPTTDAHRDRWQSAYDTREMAPEGGTTGSFSELYADSIPAHGDMYLDRDGGLWVQDPHFPWDYPLEYTRYVEGTPQMRVELPSRFFPFELHPDGILGISFDQAGVPRVQLLGLVPGDTGTVARTPREVAPPGASRCTFLMSR